MIRIRSMTMDDLALGMRLVAEMNGAAVATVATCCFGPVAWIAMMLVEATVRRRGVGNALMGYALEHLDGAGVRTVRLDATALGRPLYESLGFIAEYGLARYEGVPVLQPVGAEVGRLAPERLDELVALDRAATAIETGAGIVSIRNSCHG